MALLSYKMGSKERRPVCASMWTEEAYVALQFFCGLSIFILTFQVRELNFSDFFKAKRLLVIGRIELKTGVCLTPSLTVPHS